MATINKRFEIRTNPIDEKLIREHLNGIGAFVNCDSRIILRSSFRNAVRPVVVSIEGFVRQEEIENLIEWLHKNIESAVSIIL